MSKGDRRIPAMARRRRADWVEAAVAALVQSGPSGVAVEPLAARLGATKGSGYWHFRSRQDLLDAALEAYASRYTLAVIDRVEAGGGSARDRLVELLILVTTLPTPGAEARLLASDDPSVRATMADVTATRLAYVVSLMEACGLPSDSARRRGLAAYLHFVGHDALAASLPGQVLRSDSGRAAAADLVAALLHDVAQTRRQRAR